MELMTRSNPNWRFQSFAQLAGPQAMALSGPSTAQALAHVHFYPIAPLGIEWITECARFSFAWPLD